MKSIDQTLRDSIDKVARQRVISILLVAVLSFGGSWLWSLSRGIPIPYVHDEFSYLLAADTFAHGRLTNPPHHLWQYFETYHVLMQPTYMSKYPPGQGLFLAMGKILFGHPIYGVWLSSALMCAAVSWMLYAWVSPRWALIGGLVAVIQFGIFTYWNQSYWGGAVAAIGGALVLGALPRILKNQLIQDVFYLGLGCAVLANSRPLEGFLVAIPVGCLVLPWKIRWQELNLGKFTKNIILPLGIILSITVLGIGVYNKKITGDAGIFPHFLYDNNYTRVPSLIFQPLRPPVHFNHRNMLIKENDFCIPYYLNKRTGKSFLKILQRDSFQLWAFYFGFLLAIPSWIMLPFLLRQGKRAVRFILAVFIILCSSAIITCYPQAHYLSAMTCLAVLLITIGLKWMTGLRSRYGRIGLVFVILLIVLQLVFNIIFTPKLPVVMSLAHCIQKPPIHLPASFTREELKNILLKFGGKYLIIVKYPLKHNYFLEWVYNEADIDGAPIVWAQDMDEDHRTRLLEYFKSRQVLYIQVYWDMHGLPAYYARQ